MKRLGVVQTVSVWIAVAGFCLPHSLLASTPTTDAKPAAADVALSDGGLLLGLVLATLLLGLGLRLKDRVDDPDE